jgi:hypothetical protein
MKTAILASLLVAGVVGTVGGPSATPPAAAQETVGAAGQEKEPPVVCGFRNPSFTGLCEERTPYVNGKKLDALCQPILDCLNDTRCIKTYCGATTVRRGWVLESATREKSGAEVR